MTVIRTKKGGWYIRWEGSVTDQIGFRADGREVVGRDFWGFLFGMLHFIVTESSDKMIPKAKN